MPSTRRKHRRVRHNWAGCICPEGTTRVLTPRVTRGWACTKTTKQGPRFVKASCGQSSIPMDESSLPALPSKPKKPRKPRRKVDWTKCSCPMGSELRVNKKGGKACYAATKKRYVAANCPP